jgi:hypothetical protein
VPVCVGDMDESWMPLRDDQAMQMRLERQRGERQLTGAASASDDVEYGQTAAEGDRDRTKTPHVR